VNVPKWIAPLFFFSALYDGVLGILFLFAPGAVFDWFDVVPPNHPGYVQFPAALLLIFALIFLRIARDPVANRGLILYGILLKVAYSGLTFWHWALSGIPVIWKPFAVIDIVMGVLFVAAMMAIPAQQQGEPR